MYLLQGAYRFVLNFAVRRTVLPFSKQFAGFQEISLPLFVHCTSHIICTVNAAWQAEGAQPRLLGICAWSSDLTYVEKILSTVVSVSSSPLFADFVGFPAVHLLHHSCLIGCVCWLVF